VAQSSALTSTKVRTRSSAPSLWGLLFRERVSYLFLAPIVLLYTLFSLVPILQTFELSFFNAKIIEQGPFVGLKNYVDIFKAPAFMQAMGNTFVFTAVSTIAVLVISLGLAVLVNIPWVRGKTLFKVIFFLPVVTSLVAVGYVWKWMMDTSYGILNVALGLIGIQGPSWLSDPNVALWSLTIVNVWKWVGYFLIIFLASLQAIDQTYYEAASIDGAGPWQQFTKITLPLLRSAIVLTIILGIVNYLKSFALVFVMTQGGPAGRTELMATYVYQQAFGTGQMRFGFSAAASIVLFLFIMFFTALSNKVGDEGQVAA
jgi:multiple sugar transport system permease protein